jgi:hypothetical protein
MPVNAERAVFMTDKWWLSIAALRSYSTSITSQFLHLYKLWC